MNLQGPARSPRRRLLALMATVVAMLSLLAPAAHAQATYLEHAEQGFLDAINASRADEGLAPLVMNVELRGIARDWTSVMHAEGRLYHNPHYAEQYSGQWTRMGENVGYTMRGGDDAHHVAALHQAFLDSPGHRANIMGDYNQAGIGVIRDGDTTWVTVNFLQGEIPAQASEPDDAAARTDSAEPASASDHRTPRGERGWSWGSE